MSARIPPPAKKPDKWLVGVAADAPLPEGVVHALHDRCANLRHWLIAAEKEPTVKAVHQVRVACRRVDAALRFFKPVLPKGRRKDLRSLVKAMRRAAGACRDLDVMYDTWSGRDVEQGVLDAMAAMRGPAARTVRTTAYRIGAEGRFVQQADRLVARYREKAADGRKARGGRKSGPLPGPVTYQEWSANRLMRAVDAWTDAVPPAGAEVDALHRFRIQSKRLRYELELASPAAPMARKGAIPPLKELQDGLGEVQDAVAQVEWVERLRREVPDRVAALDALGERLRQEVPAAVARWREEWPLMRIEGIDQAIRAAVEGNQLPVHADGAGDTPKPERAAIHIDPPAANRSRP